MATVEGTNTFRKYLLYTRACFQRSITPDFRVFWCRAQKVGQSEVETPKKVGCDCKAFWEWVLAFRLMTFLIIMFIPFLV
jgi:hypothetical protein